MLAVVIALFALASPQGAAPAPPRLITVSGSGEVRVPPDEIVLTLGVETSSRELDAARADNDRRVEAMLKAAQSRGIGSEHLKTDYLHIEPRYRNDYAKTEFLGYFVRKTLVVTLRDVRAFEALLSTLLQAGATHVHDVQFQTTELRKHRDAARSMAVKAAREKAEALARDLGQQIGPPQTINETGAWHWAFSRSWWGGRWESGATQNVVQSAGSAGQADSALAPGLISVSAQVSVSFTLK